MHPAAEADSRILRVNRTLADWLGAEPGELVGRRFSDLLNIAGKIYYETHFAPLLRMQGAFNEVALDLVASDGRTLPVLVNAVERRDPEGEVRFVRITIFNASDRSATSRSCSRRERPRRRRARSFARSTTAWKPASPRRWKSG